MNHSSGRIPTRDPMHGAPIAVTKPNADDRFVSIANEPRRRKSRVVPVVPATLLEGTALVTRSFRRTVLRCVSARPHWGRDEGPVALASCKKQDEGFTTRSFASSFAFCRFWWTAGALHVFGQIRGAYRPRPRSAGH